MGGQIGDDVALTQFGVNALGLGVRQHARRQIDPGEGGHWQIPDRQRNQTRAASKIEDRPKGQTRCDLWMLQQHVADRAWDAVAQRDDVVFEAVGITVEDGSDVSFGRAF